MSDVIVYTRPDGGVSVVHPVATADIDSILQDLTDQGLSPRKTRKANLPADREYRNAWTDANPGVKVDIDLEKAKALHLDKWREARAPKLKALDEAFMRALETGDAAEQARVSAEKQALRDVTQEDLSGVTTIAELRANWPAILR